ncbi:TauD/TfdA family dioxygenase [Bartonella vinsonii]|nr:TauD/TfdA family dioxygenase [Bartonella vinsonii]
MLEPQSKKAKEALDHFYEAIKDVSFGIDVQPGRLLYIDNRIALHSRNKFWGSFDNYKIQCGEFKECLCLQIYGIIDM